MPDSLRRRYGRPRSGYSRHVRARSSRYGPRYGPGPTYGSPSGQNRRSGSTLRRWRRPRPATGPLDDGGQPHNLARRSTSWVITPLRVMVAAYGDGFASSHSCLPCGAAAGGAVRAPNLAPVARSPERTEAQDRRHGGGLQTGRGQGIEAPPVPPAAAYPSGGGAYRGAGGANRGSPRGPERNDLHEGHARRLGELHARRAGGIPRSGSGAARLAAVRETAMPRPACRPRAVPRLSCAHGHGAVREKGVNGFPSI